MSTSTFYERLIKATASVMFCLMIPVTTTGYGQAKLTTKVGNYTAVYTKDKKVRHHRYEASAKQTATVNPALSTVVEGRLWWDMALMNSKFAARRDYPEAVRDDEVFDGQARNIYADLLTESFRLKVGRQVIDWTNSLSPALIDVLTPLDLRYGVDENAAESIIPVNAASFTHSFLGSGSLEWLLVPEGAHHRLAKGENGYGYFRFLKEKVTPRRLMRREKDIPRDEKETEAGVRYQATLAGVDVMLLGYRGHQRSPAFRIEATDQEVKVTEYYPRENVFGTQLSYAQDAWVTRFTAFYEPRRDLRVDSVEDSFDKNRVYDRRVISGIGLDWVFSQHLKLYTEQYVSRLETVVPKDATADERAVEGVIDDYVGMFRATNESIDNVLLSLEAIISSPDKSQALMPSVEYTFWDHYKLATGARLFYSQNSNSRFETLKDSSYYFVRLESTNDWSVQ